MARRCHGGRRRCDYVNALTGDLVEDLELDVALVHIDAVGGRAGGHQHRTLDVGAVALDPESITPIDRIRGRVDHRPRPLEQVRRGIDLAVVGQACPATGLERVVVVARREDPAVGQQHRRGVIRAVLLLGGSQRPAVGGWIVDLDLASPAVLIDYVAAAVSLHESAAPADHDHRAVREQHRVRVGPGNVERRSGAPGGVGLTGVDRLGRLGGRVERAAEPGPVVAHRALSRCPSPRGRRVGGRHCRPVGCGTGSAGRAR